jgi:hypothetical protein
MESSMQPALLVMCTLAVLLTGCARESLPADAAPPARQAPVPAASAAVPAAAASTEPAPATTPVNAADSAADNAAVKLALSGEGLDLVSERGSVRHLMFGTPAPTVIDAITRTYGGIAPKRGRNEECGAGPLDMATWQDGLTVMAQHGRFVGWSVSRGPADADRGGPATMAGIGLGSTRRELEAAYTADIHTTTLGEEFAAGNVFGVLDASGPSARITVLWGGTSCNFR